MLVTKDGLRVISESGAGRMLMREGAPKSLLMITSGKGEPSAMLVPYDIWFQIQHFVSRIIERTQS